MAESKQYQFRCPPDVEAEFRKVWCSGDTVTDNILRVIRAGLKSMLTKPPVVPAKPKKGSR
jgi:hypothetical protein